MSHDHDAPDLPDLDTLFSPGFWDERYAGVERKFSGNPNVRLVEVVSDLAPGRALDLGAGEGGDAAWLAARGWEVVALDVSQVALDRAAASVGDDRITWRQADLRTWTPEPGFGPFDLATACYLHLPQPHHGRLMEQVATVVRPGGSLLHVSHHRDDIAVGRWDMADLMRPAADIAAELDPALWEVVRADDPTRMEVGHGRTEPVEVRDTVVHALRR
ncbi:MAG TPA: class I SAM-dependent methyltransferase [Iamia sp.]|nr:class I SAM-dependent methyltransferase [Iamia sp.]